MSNSVDQEVLQIVKDFEAELKRAKDKFNHQNSAIQEKSRNNIDLFGGTAVRQAADLVADARSACDELYASLQTLVAMLDRQCRPYIDKGIAVETVNRIWKMIEQLNEESEIQSNFTASFNSSNLGDVAAVQYVPTMDNKMVQKFWEQTFRAMPGAKEVIRKEEEEARLEEKRKLEAKKRISNLIDEEHFKTILPTEPADPSAPKSELLQKLDKNRNMLMSQLSELETAHQKMRKACETKIKALETEIEQLSAQRRALGLFKGKEKKAIDAQINDCRQKEASIEAGFEEDAQKYETTVAPINDKLEKLNEQRKLLDPKPGDEVKFGIDPLDKEKKPIMWVVVQTTAEQVYLISKEIIGYATFQPSYSDAINDDYTKWLRKFEEKAFSSAERKVLAENPLDFYGAAENVFVYTYSDAKGVLKPYLDASISEALVEWINTNQHMRDYERQAYINTASTTFWLHSRESWKELRVNRVKRNDAGEWEVRTLDKVTNNEFGEGIRPAIVLDKAQMHHVVKLG